MSDENSGMTPDEAKQHAWLNELTADERSEIEQTWKLAELGRAQEPGAEKVNRAWALVEGRMDEPGIPKLEPASGHRNLRLVRGRTMWRWAAVVLILVLGTYWWSRPVWVKVAPGEMTELVLPDGSDVVLASGSALAFKRGFRGSVRAVSLKGEAFFDVVASDVPFVVETFNARVQVLGTQFNVRAWQNDEKPETEVVLKEGIVRFASLAPGGTSVHLEAGQSSVLSAGKTQPTGPNVVEASTIATWREGGFFFHDKPLTTIVAEVERRYGIQIAVAEEIKNDSMVLFHSRPAHVEVLLEAICALKGYRFRVTNNGYELIR